MSPLWGSSSIFEYAPSTYVLGSNNYAPPGLGSPLCHIPVRSPEGPLFRQWIQKLQGTS
jgi:hypothetical protein